MSQPPNQPPQGGFGAPQDPRQGGFGAPQPPQPGASQTPPQAPPPPQGPPQAPPPPQSPPPAAPQPGYGYPQQPGQPQQSAQANPYGQPDPYASGPYGQPQQQPGPYGYPQHQPGPYGQQPAQGYGYPPQPQYPGAPGSGSRNPFKGKPALVIGAAVAALLVIGGTVLAVTRGGDDNPHKPVAQGSDNPKGSESPSASEDSGGGADPENLNGGRQPGEAKVLWYKQAPDAPKSGAEAPGLWITDKAAVKAAYKQVFAYNITDGEETWAPITLPQKICAVTPQASSDNKIVVAYESGTSDRAKCNQIQQIDLTTGAKGWKDTVSNGGLFDNTIKIDLSITGKTLMVGRAQSGTAYDVNSGNKLWEKKRYGDKCFPAAFAGGEKLIAVASCDATGSNEHEEIQELDPATGKAKWTQKYDKGWQIARVFSIDPLVIYSTNKDKKAWNISTLGPGGKFRSEVGVDLKIGAECGWAILERKLRGCAGVAADANTLYLPTESLTSANEIVAIDLANGKEKWRVKSPVDEPMLPVKVEDGKLIAYAKPSYDAGGQVLSIPVTGSSHQPEKLLQNPAGAARVENAFFSRVYDWVDGRFYLASTRLSGNDEAKEKLILAFGK